jgi:DNA-binding transcriptional LysR family regulator
MLDSWALRVLVEVADRGSFSAAAQSLTMTQPAVSRQVAVLERKLGVALFHRLPRGIRPTAAGAAAVDGARDILRRMGELRARMSAYTDLDTGQVRISAFPSANTSFVPEAVRRLRVDHPGIEVSLLRDDPAAVADGRLDIALVTSWDHHMPDGVELVPLLDDEHRVALPPQHPLARRARVSLRELCDATWIEGAHPDCLGPLGALADSIGGPPHIGFQCDDWNGKQALVAAGLGITMVPTLAAEALRPDIKVRPTTPALPRRRVLAATAPADHRTPAANAMLTVLTTLGAEIGRRQ